MADSDGVAVATELISISSTERVDCKGEEIGQLIVLESLSRGRFVENGQRFAVQPRKVNVEQGFRIKSRRRLSEGLGRRNNGAAVIIQFIVGGNINLWLVVIGRSTVTAILLIRLFSRRRRRRNSLVFGLQSLF